MANIKHNFSTSQNTDQLRELLSVWKETAEESETLSLKNRIYELPKCVTDVVELPILANLKSVLRKLKPGPLSNEKPLFSPPRSDSGTASVQGSFTETLEITRAKRTEPRAEGTGRTKLDFINESIGRDRIPNSSA
jgi:hypothetical protein